MSQSPENRKFERVNVSLPAKLSILVPEHTFSPLEYDCEVMDLSERGAMIMVQLLPESYSQMLQKTRYCRLRFSGIPGLPDRVTGRAVWLQPQGKDEHRTYRVGLFFEDCPLEIVTALKNYVNDIKSSGASTTA